MSKLQERRNEQGMSQRDLAERSGISKRVIQNYEQGFRALHKASFITCKRLADALECDVMDIVDMPDEEK